MFVLQARHRRHVHVRDLLPAPPAAGRSQTAVVQENDIELAVFLYPLAVLLVDDGRRPRDERLVARRLLARAVSRQEAQDLRDIFDLRDELLIANEDDVDARQSRRDARISFVRHETGRRTRQGRVLSFARVSRFEEA